MIRPSPHLLLIPAVAALALGAALFASPHRAEVRPAAAPDPTAVRPVAASVEGRPLRLVDTRAGDTHPAAGVSVTLDVGGTPVTFTFSE